MLRRVAVVAAMGLLACGQPRGRLGALERDLGFEPTPFETARERTLIISNIGDAPLQVAVSLDATADFSVSPPTLSVAPRTSAPLTIVFRPSRLGARDALLFLESGGGSAQVALHGTGTGAQLDVADEIILDPALLVPGEGPAHARGTLVLRNTGTRSAPLRINAITPNAPSLCIGEECAGISRVLLPREAFTVPLDATLSEAGAASWTVTIASDDPAAPSRLITVRALATALEVCDFALPPSLSLETSMGTLRLQHRGTGRCLVRELGFTPDEGVVGVRVQTQPTLPVKVDALLPLTLVVTTTELGVRRLGVLHVVTAGRPVIDVPVFLHSVNALTLAPSEINFGTRSAGCAATTRIFNAYNPSGFPVVIERIALVGDPAFSLTSATALPLTLEPGSTVPASFRVSFQPTAAGRARGVIEVTTRANGISYVSLDGVAEALPQTTDVFQVFVRPQFDMVFVVDTSPSFAARRSAIRNGIATLLTIDQQLCADLRVAFAPAEGAAGATPALSRSDAGEVWTSWRAPDFVNRAMSAFDALPASSETEACVGPLSQLLLDAGVRAEALLSVSCVTDALEHTPNPQPLLTGLKQAFPRLKYDAMTGTEHSTCAVEAIDDGMHQQLVDSTFGAHFDVCDSTSWQQWGTTGDCVRLDYFLNNRPQGAVTVLKDGLPVSPSQAHFDAATNSVKFEPGVLLGGERIEVSYQPACIP